VPPGGYKPGPKRHQSLEASLRWLVQRLPEDQQAALHRLAGLPDTFSAQQAEREQRLNEEWLTRWKNVGLLGRDVPGGRRRGRLRQLYGLALARSGAVDAAWEVLLTLSAERHDDSETLGLLARTRKGLAAASDRPEERATHLREAYKTYRSAYERHGETWLGI